MKLSNRGNLIMGILLGLILPVVVIILVYALKFNQYTLKGFLTLIFELKVAGNFLQLAGISNLLLFFGFMRFDKMYASRGVILSTLILAVVVALLIFT